MNVPKILIACLIVVTIGARAASADQIIFSNLGPNDSYDLDRALWFGFDFGQEGDPDSNTAQAVSFMPDATATLRTIQLPLEFPWSFHDGTFELNLYESAGGMPGRLLESFTSAATHPATQLSIFASVHQPVLFAGAMYFLETRAIGMADGLWYLTLTDPDQRIPGAYRIDGGDWRPIVRAFTPALLVTGDANPAVPEPGTLVLLGSGMALAAWRRRTSTAPR